MMNFKKLNRIVGWAVFAIAAAVYLVTMEPSSSLWDCSEFIATSYKLEVGHPPGAPLFMMMARVATMLAPSTHYVPHMVNAMNCIASAFCILFLFWTITHLGRRLYMRAGEEVADGRMWAVLGAGVVGALAYTFTDTFWFSAVEGEVYALSSMFTALVVWLMLRWEEEADEPHALRWIVLIAYLMGLSIGVHILNLLTIPALVFIYYFRRTERVTVKGIALATVAAFVLLGFVNNIIIPYTVYAGAMFDVLFVNTFGLPVNSGMVFFALGLVALLAWGVWATHKRGWVVANMLVLSTLMIIIGYSSYASMTIRAAANPPMNSNDPDDPHALLSVLNRDQYGDRPLLYGAYYSAPLLDYKQKTVYTMGEDGKYHKGESLAGYVHPEEFMHLFPRMWNYAKGERGYKPWAAYRTVERPVTDEEGNVVRDENGRIMKEPVTEFGRKRTYRGYEYTEPTFAENLRFFFSYQLGYMYWRYFLWNFVGRQDDIQATSSTLLNGNWRSGFNWIDEPNIGPQEDLPREVAGNKGRNAYYFLPFLLGLVGLLYQLNRDQRNFVVVMWLFIMMGVALVVYFNTSPNEPRERDYVYAGSFYAFAIWIGLGVMALFDALATLGKRNSAALAAVATLVGLAVPGILAAQNWDDHDRSHRTFARDIGWNYLNSTLPNAIIFDYGDNDTFPLWLNQEIDGVRTDVRIVNTSYLGGDWYIDEMKLRSNESAPVPFTLPRRKYQQGTNDLLVVEEVIDRPVPLKQAIDFILSDDPKTKTTLGDDRPVDYLPTKKLALPVNKDNAIAAGIVKEEDRDLMVDTVYMTIRKNSLDKSEMMQLDALAHFDWKRPIHFTQPHIPDALGLRNYLQFDGYSYRLVPILTPSNDIWNIGRVDPDVVVPLLNETFRYGNLSDPRVYVDNFIQYNLESSMTRAAFARAAMALLERGEKERAVALLDRALEVLPLSQIRFTEGNTMPLIEAYYVAGANEKGDALLKAYTDNLREYIDWYAGFDRQLGEQVMDQLEDCITQYERAYVLAHYAKRTEIVKSMKEYMVLLGYDESELDAI